MECTLRVLNREMLPVFRPYLLPETAARLENQDPTLLALGAVTGRNSCGAVAAELDGEEAALTDLFVDAAARRQGTGALLLDKLLARLDAMGVNRVSASYVLGGEELAGMDHLLVSRGFSQPQVRSRVFAVHTGMFHDNPLVGGSFTGRHRPAAGVCTLDQLPAGKLEAVEQEEDLPDFLWWSSLRDRTLPELSAALVREGRVEAYVLVGASTDGGYILLSAVRRKHAPPNAFLLLLQEVLNCCWYYSGGDFPLYFSVLHPHVETLVLRLLGNRFTSYSEHICTRDRRRFYPAI